MLRASFSNGQTVSTHSRLKAAGSDEALIQSLNNGFNTQPPEGGWAASQRPAPLTSVVSTHSRLKAAGKKYLTNLAMTTVSTHSRLKAAGF